MLNFKDITTWSVSKGIAKPKNNREYSQVIKGFIFDSTISPSEGWLKFEQFAQQHTYVTDAPNGSYSADRFGGIVWQSQCMSIWSNMSCEPKSENKRQFLPFIHRVKEAEPGFCKTISPTPLKDGEVSYWDNYAAQKLVSTLRIPEQPESPKFGEWISVDPDADIEDTELQHFEEYFIVVKETEKVIQALFCDWDTEGVGNTWVINDQEYPLSFATHYQRVIYPSPPKTL